MRTRNLPRTYLRLTLLILAAAASSFAQQYKMSTPIAPGVAVPDTTAETTEAFLEGHVQAFAYFGGVPTSILYDNMKLAVVRILGDGTREKTRAFSELQSHYLFADKFGRPAKGKD